MRIAFLCIAFLFFEKSVSSQDSLKFLAPSPEFHQKRFVFVSGLQAGGYGGSLALLAKTWYKEYDHTSFHFFDDSREWLQMDKAGHLTTSWYLGRVGMDMMEWSGVPGKKAIWYGTAGSFLYLTGIELLDGFSAGWGFSWSDFTANTVGTGFIIGQKFIRAAGNRSFFLNGVGAISLKYSFNQTQYPIYRPALLGNTYTENMLKDYNGQTYWMSFNISSFLKTENKFPKWLNLAVGYGGEGMISGNAGFAYVTEQGNTIEFERYRQYYLSLDIDLTRIKTRSRLLKTIFTAFSFVKIPAPALEFNKTGTRFHPW